MAATIYKHPEHISYRTLPFPKSDGWQKYCDDQQAEDDRFVNELREWCKTQHPTNKYVGEVIRIPHADSYASYMVHNMRPLELIVLPLGDAWNAPMADLLTPTRVVEMIEADKKLKKSFHNA